MSAFLGPIHYIMYEKIQNTEALTQEILRAAGESETALAAHCPPPARGDLQKIIDTTNIHGWLSREVSAAETRLGLAAAALTEDKPTQRKVLLEIGKEQGSRAGESLPAAAGCGALYRGMSSFWLDGMPCDGGVSVQSEDEDQALWSLSPAVHAPFIPDLSLYFDLRAAWMEGFTENKAAVLTRLNDTTFQLMKE